MKARHCEVASNSKFALATMTKDQMHETCPQAYRLPDGSVHACDCPCHAEETIDLAFIARTRRLPVMDPPPADGAEEPTSGRKAAEKRPLAGRSCECGCGRRTRGRFAPGHDAKLKSSLTFDADHGDASAWAELVVRAWAHLVSDRKVEVGVRTRGDQLVQDLGTPERRQAFLERRALERSGETVPSP